MLLLGMLPDLKEKQVNLCIAVTLIGEITNYIVYFLGEGYVYGKYYFLMTVIAIALYCIAEEIYEKYIERKKLSSVKGN